MAVWTRLWSTRTADVGKSQKRDTAATAGWLGWLHGSLVLQRRARRLSDVLAGMLPAGASVVDVGCGDGLIDRLICERRRDVSITGIDILARPGSHIPVSTYDGATLPIEDHSVDVVMFVDVLHHTDDPERLLREARRVARQAIVIKDHARDGLFAGATLRLMDWVGNSPYGVALTYNYWPRSRWLAAFDSLDLVLADWRDGLDLYPPPAKWLFERSLHFVTRLEPA
jgi:SAM-dependent methyltransferase